MIAKRTSERLQALKASGRPWMSRKSGRLVERLGSPDPSKGSAAGCEARRSKADEFAAKMLPIIDAMRARGHHDAGRHRRRAHAAEMADGSQCRELVDDGGVEHLEAGAL